MIFIEPRMSADINEGGLKEFKKLCLALITSSPKASSATKHSNVREEHKKQPTDPG